MVATSESSEAFAFEIADVFHVTGRGTIVTGHVDSGALQNEDIVQICDKDEVVATTRARIDIVCRVGVDPASQPGDVLSLLLPDVSKSQLRAGYVLTQAPEEHEAGRRRAKARRAEAERQGETDRLKAGELAREVARLEQQQVLERAIGTDELAAHPGWVTAGMAVWTAGGPGTASYMLRVRVNLDGHVKPAEAPAPPSDNDLELVPGQMALVLLNLDNRKRWLRARDAATHEGSSG